MALQQALYLKIQQIRENLIIAHIGSNKSFVNDALWAFESKKTGNYHEEMNSVSFEQWFSKVLDKVEANAMIVMDNAPYFSRKINKVSNSE